jgi:Predicted nucleotide-binding protein containing TIR -like domain
MPRTTVFIGSSAAAKAQATAIVQTFSSATLEFLPWWEAFVPGQTLLEGLDGIRDRVDAALLVFSPESETTIRKKKVAIPNLNVLFEFGYLYGSLGSAKVAMIRYGDLYLPSDLGGYVHIFGSRSFRRGGTVQVGQRTQRDFARWIGQV